MYTWNLHREPDPDGTSSSILIKLTRLNGQTFYINAIYIEQVQSFPDTTITLTNGKKFVVREHEEDVILLVKNFYRDVNLFDLTIREKGEEE